MPSHLNRLRSAFERLNQHLQSLIQPRRIFSAKLRTKPLITFRLLYFELIRQFVVLVRNARILPAMSNSDDNDDAAGTVSP